MKAKLTVTIDEELIPKAKEQARSQGLSLSDLIERALRGLTLESASHSRRAGEEGSRPLAGRMIGTRLWQRSTCERLD